MTTEVVELFGPDIAKAIEDLEQSERLECAGILADVLELLPPDGTAADTRHRARFRSAITELSD